LNISDAFKLVAGKPLKLPVPGNRRAELGDDVTEFFKDNRWLSSLVDMGEILVVPRDGDAPAPAPAAVAVEPEPEPEPEPVAEESGEFDPSEHSAADVIARAESNPDEAAALLDAEMEGKARKGVVTALTEIVQPD